MSEQATTTEADPQPLAFSPTSSYEAGLLFEIDIAAFPADVSGPMREWGRSLASSLRTYFEIRGEAPRFVCPPAVALAALERDARRLEAFAAQVVATADDHDNLAPVLRGGGFLLRRLIRELEEGRRHATGGGV